MLSPGEVILNLDSILVIFSSVPHYSIVACKAAATLKNITGHESIMHSK